MANDEGANVDESDTPTQAELYEDLKRIGELEDQKRTIQEEIDQRTSRLKAAIPQLEQDSLLYQMLSKSFASPAANSRVTKKVVKSKTAKATKKKVAKKK